MKLRAPGQYDVDLASLESGLECNDISLTQQQFKDDADINVIMERFNRTGELPALVAPGQFDDFTEVTDYHTAMNMVVSAQQAFQDMPARIRSRFENDAGKFVEFVNDPSNLAEGVELGVFEAPQGHTGLLDVSVPTDTKEEQKQ
jgi:phage internal scaffolding protein